MAAIENTTPEVRAEAELFTVGFDTNDHPILKAADDMTAAEQCAALAIAKEEMERTAAACEHLLPLAEANYLPESLEMSLQLLDKLLPAVEAKEKAVRLADLVLATGAH
jgi:hypothetical protein